MGGSFPWRGSSSHPVECGGFRSLGRGPSGGDGGDTPLYGFWVGFRFGVIVLNWFRVGRAHASLWLAEGTIVWDVDGLVVAMVRILVWVWL